MLGTIKIALLTAIFMIFSGSTFFKHTKYNLNKMGFNILAISVCFILAQIFGPSEYTVNLDKTFLFRGESYYLGWEINRLMPFDALANPIGIKDTFSGYQIIDIPDSLKAFAESAPYQPHSLFTQYLFYWLFFTWLLISRKLFNQSPTGYLRELAKIENTIENWDLYIKDLEKRSIFTQPLKHLELKKAKRERDRLSQTYGTGLFALLKASQEKAKQNGVENTDQLNTHKKPLHWIAEQIADGHRHIGISVEVLSPEQARKENVQMYPWLTQRNLDFAEQKEHRSFINPFIESKMQRAENKKNVLVSDKRSLSTVESELKGELTKSINTLVNKCYPEPILQLDNKTATRLLKIKLIPYLPIYMHDQSGNGTDMPFKGFLITGSTDNDNVGYLSNSYLVIIEGYNNDSQKFAVAYDQQTEPYNIFVDLIRRNKATVKGNKYEQFMNGITNVSVIKSIIEQSFSLSFETADKVRVHAEQATISEQERQALLKKMYEEFAPHLYDAAKGELVGEAISTTVDLICEKHPELINGVLDDGLSTLIEMGIEEELATTIIDSCLGFSGLEGLADLATGLGE